MKTQNVNQATLIQFLMARDEHVFEAQSFREFLNDTHDFAMLGMTFAEFNDAKNDLIDSGILALKKINNKLFATLDMPIQDEFFA